MWSVIGWVAFNRNRRVRLDSTADPTRSISILRGVTPASKFIPSSLRPLASAVRKRLPRGWPYATRPRRSGKPKLGIVGFFGHGNYGDELFWSVFEQYFGRDFDLVLIPDLPTKPYFSTPVSERVSQVDAIVIGGGDLIRPWAVDARYFNKAYLEKPVFMVGLGVPIRSADPSLNDRPHISRRYAAFFQHPNVKFVGLRDDSSRDWVIEHLNPTAPVVSVPDIVCALDLPVAPEKSGRPILGIATRLRPNQDEPDDYTELARLASAMQSEGWRVRHLILGTGPVGERDRENADDLVIDGKEIFYSEDLDEISRAIGECSALASMKFHGSVVATMYGVPSMVLIPTSKNRSFMRRIGRDDLLSVFNDETLTERFSPPPAAPDASAVTGLREAASALMRDLNKRVKRQVR